MRSAILQIPAQRTSSERRKVLDAAIRHDDRAEIYMAAVAYMDLDDREAQRAVMRLRADLESLKRYLEEMRAGTLA